MRHIKLRDLDSSKVELGVMGMTHGYTCSQTDDALSFRPLGTARQLGVTLIDTARFYSLCGNKEVPGRARRGCLFALVETNHLQVAVDITPTQWGSPPAGCLACRRTPHGWGRPVASQVQERVGLSRMLDGQ